MLADYLQSASSSSSSSSTATKLKFRDWHERRIFRYVSAVLTIVVGIFLHQILASHGLRLVYITFYISVTVSALLGGLGPGLLATLFAALWADYFYLHPAGKL